MKIIKIFLFNSSPSCANETLIKSILETNSKKIQDIINSNLIKYKANLSSLSNNFHNTLKNQTKLFRDSLKESSESFKIKLKKNSNKKREDLISLFHEQCFFNQNKINEQLNMFEELISFV